MRAVTYFLIEAKDTHKEKTESGILLMANFDNQSKANQVYKIHSVPNKYKDVAKEGDLLVVHFNVVVFELYNEKRIPSKNYIQDDIFYVPDNMLHAVLDPVTFEIKHLFGEWAVVKPIIENEDKATESGIVYELKKTEEDLKKDFMRGEIVKSGIIPTGIKVMMDNYSDYNVEFPNKENFWFVLNSQIIASYED